MAITLHLYYTGRDDTARRFAREMLSSGTVEKIRQEPGNLQYDYFFPMEDEHTVLLVDSWQSQEAIDLHHHSPMMGTIMALREKYDLHMRVERFVSDEAGVPQNDQEYIKE